MPAVIINIIIIIIIINHVIHTAATGDKLTRVGRLLLQLVFLKLSSLYCNIYIHLYSPHNVVVQHKQTKTTSKKTTNEKEE